MPFRPIHSNSLGRVPIVIIVNTANKTNTQYNTTQQSCRRSPHPSRPPSRYRYSLSRALCVAAVLVLVINYRSNHPLPAIPSPASSRVIYPLLPIGRFHAFASIPAVPPGHIPRN